VYTWSKQGVSQCVRCIIGRPSAAVGDRFIVPAYTKTPTK